MSDAPSSTPSSSPHYTPPPELLMAAEAMLEGGTSRELVIAAEAYTAYGRSIGGRSGVSGAELPAFEQCPILPRAGWLAVVRFFAALYGRSTVASENVAEGVDPFLLGIREIAAATRDLAEASTLLSTSDSDASKAVAALVQDMAKCLSAQVRELAPPSEA